MPAARRVKFSRGPACGRSQKLDPDFRAASACVVLTESCTVVSSSESRGLFSHGVILLTRYSMRPQIGNSDRATSHSPPGPAAARKLASPRPCTLYTSSGCPGDHTADQYARVDHFRPSALHARATSRSRSSMLWLGVPSTVTTLANYRQALRSNSYYYVLGVFCESQSERRILIQERQMM